MLYILFSIVAVFGAGCQKKPSLGAAADPFSPLSPPPMGASTYNDELKRELEVLDDLLNARLGSQQLSEVKQVLMEGRSQGRWQASSNEAYLVKVYLALPELIHDNALMSANKKLWYKAKLLFLRRRFIEAAMHLSEVLKQEPNFSTARNWRARAIFFLGNPDLAINELNTIIAKEPLRSEASLDALYLIGAIVYESNDKEPERIKPGIEAWQKYLSLSQTEPRLKKEIESSLEELALRLRGESSSAAQLSPDLFAPNQRYSAEKNAVLRAFMQEELLLAQKLCDQALAKAYDRDLAVIKARIYIKTGRVDESALLFSQIVKANKAYAPGFHYRGMVFMMKGQIKDAILSWQEALKIDEAYAKSHNLEQRMAVAQKMLAAER